MTHRTSIAKKISGSLKILLPLVALFVGVGSFVMLKANRPVPPKSHVRETVHPVRTMVASLATHQPAMRLYGEVITGRKVELRALVAGKVIKTGKHLREGALVKKGDLLLAIDPFSYKGAVVEAKAKIAETHARAKEIKARIKAEQDSIKYSSEQLDISSKDWRRAQRLAKSGTVTRQNREARELIVSQRRQTLEGKRSNLNVLQAQSDQQIATLSSLQWRLQQALKNLADTSLKAPYDGYINEVNANMGRMLNVNDKVAILLDNHWMDVVFTLSDQQYGRFLETGAKLIGRKIEVTWKLGTTPLAYSAIVERVAARISSETGGVSVYARLQNPTSSHPIRAGAFVDVNVPDRTYRRVARLPQTAIYGREKVYVVAADKRLKQRRVKVVAIDGEHVLVRGALQEGDRVVVTRMSTIGTGMKVRDMGAGTMPLASPQKSDDVSAHGKSHKESRWKPSRG